MGTQSKQILLVDNFAPWRRFIETLLSVTPEWKLCGEAINGAEALVKAEELHPDLVLLDLDLPDITGIELACHLQLIVPTPKVVFFAAAASPHLVNAALGTGASGYLLKSQLVGELLTALKEVFAGNRFISSGIDF